MTKRGNHKPGAGSAPNSGTYVREIIKCLEKVNSLSGCHNYQIFEDWSQLVQVCLEALPAHLIALARTGHFADDTAETQQVFERLRSRYQPPPYRSKSADAWQYFSQAFALLLESAEPGLWGPASYSTFDCGYAGPDVIGQIFMEFTHPSPRTGQYLTPWPVVMLMSQVTGGGTAEVYARLKL